MSGGPICRKIASRNTLMAPNCNDWEIRVLLDMWADDKIQESLESSGRNIMVYRRIADRFNRALRYGEPGTDGLPDSAHAHLSVSCLKRLSLEAV